MRNLKEQIDSILAQKEVEVYLFVRDDVSSDRTLSILEKYKEQNKLNYVIGKKNIGAGCSFLHLLYKTYLYNLLNHLSKKIHYIFHKFLIFQIQTLIFHFPQI